jgi:DNA-binding response OmpR family regulator
MRILVIEDDRDIADLIAHYVRKEGWEARLEATGDEGLAHAQRETVDLIVLDVMLHGLSGLEVCRALRADTSTAAIPIIMVTARADEGDRIMGLELGADDYMGKSFSPKELVARIRALMRRARLFKENRVDNADDDGYCIRSGIIVVPKDGIIEPETVA